MKHVWEAVSMKQDGTAAHIKDNGTILEMVLDDEVNAIRLITGHGRKTNYNNRQD